ncbi:TetR/AcrR family transcriptional regulator [Paenibacillus senegalensis]|uniref:TetR/AcrR family transcriptional regulator n=1 Tax=Paenibacillus senegalensis TaxID=1465766 RepID=UPI0002881124|nr:TetR family transcriptional regulator [Paenibacillus senegalensis]
MEKQSLRDMKKEATGQALAEAAFELALERGLDGFVIEDVVHRARYSRRTFANYFSCKEEAVAAAAISSGNKDEFDNLLANIDESVTPLEILYRLMRMQLTADLFQRMRELVSLSRRYPTLEPFLLSIIHQLQASGKEILVNTTQGRYTKEYTHLLVGAVYGAILPLLDGSLDVRFPGQVTDENAEAITFDQYLDLTINCLRNGF